MRPVTLSRRDVLWALGALGGLAFVPSCHPKLDRREVLAAIVRDVLVPSTHQVVSDSRALGAALEALDGETPSLAVARTTFKRALLSWKRASTLKSGPIVETNALLRAAFWPARPKAVEGLLADPRPIDERRIEEVGADAKGLFGIEYVLFAGDDGTLDERRRRYLVEAAINVVAYAERTAKLLGDGSAFARSFAAAGRASLEQVLAQSTDAIEVVVGRIARILRLRAQGTLRANDVEGYHSSTSLDIALALLAGTEAAYLGSGNGSVSDLVVQVTPPVDARMWDHFAAARGALAALGAPLEQAALAKEADLVRAQAALRTLEITMKTELTSALGITIVFSGSDGD